VLDIVHCLRCIRFTVHFRNWFCFQLQVTGGHYTDRYFIILVGTVASIMATSCLKMGIESTPETRLSNTSRTMDNVQHNDALFLHLLPTGKLL
jgi:hypothetical protein